MIDDICKTNLFASLYKFYGDFITLIFAGVVGPGAEVDDWNRPRWNVIAQHPSSAQFFVQLELFTFNPTDGMSLEARL